MSDRCPVCGAVYALVGRAHNCRPIPVANRPADVANKPATKSASYKYRDAEKRRAYQAELMRKRRAAGKEDAVKPGPAVGGGEGE
jgi:hypothetical protein